MKLPSDVKNIVSRKFQIHHQSWLKTSALENAPSASWPVEINLNPPTEKQALVQQEGVREWITAWRAWESHHAKPGAASLAWGERNWRTLGTQNVPEKLLLHTPEAIVFWIGKTDEWNTAVTRYKTMVQQWQVLNDVMPKHYRFLANCNEADFSRLIETVKWICDNPNSNLYPRQIPVHGIDSKWLESHKGLVTELVATISGKNTADFFTVCGLKPPPQLIRIRILDSQLRSKTGGLCDISIPVEEAAGLAIEPARVYIVENIQSALAFGDLPGAVVIMGLGYAVEPLSRLPWLCGAHCIYWGDIDTHGFAILNRARKHLPNLESLLMDEATLLDHRHLWVKEEKPLSSTELPLLTAGEKNVYNSIKANTWGQNIRLEQERIYWEAAWHDISEKGIKP
ncbi:MAG: DUF2220 family protein [Spirochaetes bacterium]|nr:DUF2220 family protein [Spirochaetota bacterium]